ncbi:hypothetical protein AACH06_29205 [Ideonella sp. DXS29W]|uniref:Uncharacterized protein n=1 Tax=Ideonella lacteola TaxID=2984193 RepID=A0ABU9BY61_9BURK
MSSRLDKLNQPVTEATLRKTLRTLFSPRNDYGDLDFGELSQELERFGITTQAKFSLLMKRHRRRLIELDRRRLSAQEVKFYSAEIGKEFVKDAIRRQYWFAFPALVRSALELEFGEEAVVREPHA